jgi:hypothetical protein
MPAASLIFVSSAHDNPVCGRHEPLAPVGGGPAAHADRQRLVHELGDGEELGHRLEGSAHVVLVKPGHDHADPSARQGLDDLHQRRVEELPLVDRDDLGSLRDAIQDLASGAPTSRGIFISEWLTMWSAS